MEFNNYVLFSQLALVFLLFTARIAFCVSQVCKTNQDPEKDESYDSLIDLDTLVSDANKEPDVGPEGE